MVCMVLLRDFWKYLGIKRRYRWLVISSAVIISQLVLIRPDYVYLRNSACVPTCLDFVAEPFMHTRIDDNNVL